MVLKCFPTPPLPYLHAASGLAVAAAAAAGAARAEAAAEAEGGWPDTGMWKRKRARLGALSEGTPRPGPFLA